MPERKDGLSRWAAAEKQATIDKIDHIISVVDAEVSEHGFYPHNRKRLTKEHVLNRAGVHVSTLKNSTHADTRKRFDDWLKGVRKKLKKRRRGAVDFDKVNSMRSAIDAIGTELHLMKLEHNEALFKLAELEAERVQLARRNAELESEVAELRAGGANIRRMRR